MVLFRQKRLYLSEVVVLKKNWLYSGKSGCIQEKNDVFGKNGCIGANVVVFGQCG